MPTDGKAEGPSFWTLAQVGIGIFGIIYLSIYIAASLSRFGPHPANLIWPVAMFAVSVGNIGQGVRRIRAKTLDS